MSWVIPWAVFSGFIPQTGEDEAIYGALRLLPYLQSDGAGSAVETRGGPIGRRSLPLQVSYGEINILFCDYVCRHLNTFPVSLAPFHQKPQ